MINVTCRLDNLSQFKIHDFRLSSQQVDNYLAGKSLSHMQTFGYQGKKFLKYEPAHEISNNVVCATSKGSDQPAHTRSLIRAFASRLSIL